MDVVVGEKQVIEGKRPSERVAKRPKGSYRLSDFIVQRTLGTGSFGRVHLGMDSLCVPVQVLTIVIVRSKHNLRFYAVKVLSKERVVKMKQVEHTNNEQHMLEAVQHPFIINLWGTFQDAANLYMVMDFVPGGELFTLLRRSNVSAIEFDTSLPCLCASQCRGSPTPLPNSTPLKSRWLSTIYIVLTSYIAT